MDIRQASSHTLLFLGGALIVAASAYTVGHLTDRVVYTVLLPGFVFGLIAIGVSVSLRKH